MGFPQVQLVLVNRIRNKTENVIMEVQSGLSEIEDVQI